MRFSSLLSACLFAIAHAQDDINDDEVSAQYRMYGFNNCNSNEKKAFLKALKEKDTITGVDSSQKINWHGALVNDFFG